MKWYGLVLVSTVMCFVIIGCFHEDPVTNGNCNNAVVTGPACADCDPSNPAHVACPAATPQVVQDIFNTYCFYCHYYQNPDPAFPNDPIQGGEGWANTGGGDTDMALFNNALALTVYDPVTLGPIPEEAPVVSYQRLVGAVTYEMPTVAPTLRVDPGNINNSYLYQKITSDTPKEGNRMPFGPLSARDICIIQTWIEMGAKVASMDATTDYSACEGM